MAKYNLYPPKKNYKYSVVLQESCSNGRWTDVIYGDNITEIREKLYARAKRVKWHMTASDPIGSAYEYGMVDPYKSGQKYWGIKKSLAYLTYDKRGGVIWWDPREGSGKLKRMINSDGTLGVTWDHYYKMLNKLRR